MSKSFKLPIHWKMQHLPILLMVQKSCVHQLRLVAYRVSQGFIDTRLCRNSSMYHLNPFDKFLHEDFDMKARVLFRQFGGQTFKISFQVLTQLLLMVQKSCPVFCFANIPVFIGLDTSQVVFSPEFSDQQVILKINSCLTSSSKVQGSSRVFTLEIFTWDSMKMGGETEGPTCPH